MSNEDQIIYGVQLLDDLHNYFPDLLYNNSRFTNVQDVLQYITTNTRRRFDLYNYGRRQYYPPIHTRRTRPAATSVNTHDTYTDDERVQTPPAPAPATAAAAPAEPESASARGSSPQRDRSQQRVPIIETTVLRTPLTFNTPLYSQAFDFGSTFTTDYAPTLATTLQSLLGGSDSVFLNNFLNPVEVRPTTQQIDRATQVRTHLIQSTEEEEDTCAICQEEIRINDNVREINHCHHTFHKLCIDTWFNRNVHCPVCRFDIREMEATPNTDILP